MSACQSTDVFSSAINPGRREAWHTAQRKAAKQHRGESIFDLFIRAFSLLSRNVGLVDQGCDWKTIGMTPKYKHRSDLRGTPGSAYPQPEPNATELPSCAPISARDAQRRRRRRWWRGDEGARRPSPEAQVLRHVLWHALRNALRNCAASLACSSFTCRLGKEWGAVEHGDLSPVKKHLSNY